MAENLPIRPEVITGEKAHDLTEAVIQTAANYHDASAPGFASEDAIRSAREGGYYAGPDTVMELESDVDIPVSMIIGAIGFDSWEGRPRGNLKDGRPSKDVIEDYAERDTELPGIDMGVDIYLADDGRAFVVSHNAHRTAAAKQRGQETIKAQGGVSIYHLKHIPHELHRKGRGDIEGVGVGHSVAGVGLKAA